MMKNSGRQYVRMRIEENGDLSRVLRAGMDFVILNVSFFLVYFARLGSFRISRNYINLLMLFYVFWLFISAVARKFRLEPLALRNSALLLLKSALALLYAISFCVVFLKFPFYSRLQIFGTCLLMLILELAFFSLVPFGRSPAKVWEDAKKQAALPRHFKTSVSLLISDFILLNVVFFGLNLYKRGSFVLSPDYERILLLLYGLWITGAILTRKFNIQNFHNFYHALAANIKAIVFMALSVSAILFALRLHYLSRLHIFGTLLLLSFLEAILTYLYFVIKLEKEPLDDIESVEAVRNFFGQEDLPLGSEKTRDSMTAPTSFMDVLVSRYLSYHPGVHEFARETINLVQINHSETAVLNSPEFLDLDLIKTGSARLLINFHRINDVRWINRYFLEVHERLSNGGYFLGRADTIATHKRHFFMKYPHYLAEVFYALHFVFFRVFPKLPQVRKLYFALTKGKNRMISRAEVLGRLSFCGFRIVGEKEIEDSLFFVAQKTKSPCIDQNPSYGLLIRLKRAGLNGRMIEVYKLRTMYPYSEYLQEYIYRNQKLSDGGKINEDFRVTDWGGFIRKYWLDELPMLFNWIKGDLKLFGVRPLSGHYLSLYDEYVQKLRTKVKPGLVPPYYADLPKKIEDISNSEKRYIESYIEHPLRTQFLYFTRAVGNILFKGARSG
jgi:hypothetical protein